MNVARAEVERALDGQAVRGERILAEAERFEFEAARLVVEERQREVGAKLLDLSKTIAVSATLDDREALRAAQAEIARLQEVNRQLSADLTAARSAAQRDVLTGLLNRGGFEELLETEWQRGLRSGLPLGLVFVDVDHFKEINDAFGHASGDVALQSIARVLEKAAARSGDVAARWGGDEFAIVVPGAEPGGVMALAERLRAAVADLVLRPADGSEPKRLSASIGCASMLATRRGSSADVVGLADKAVYEAKEAGRNRAFLAAHEESQVVFYEAEPADPDPEKAASVPQPSSAPSPGRSAVSGGRGR